jgi:hypothetical protein
LLDELTRFQRLAGRSSETQRIDKKTKENEMITYTIPELKTPPPAKVEEIFLVASGDLRLSANQLC